jgi:glycosyltransferase involved in cell wall biosynthesis
MAEAPVMISLITPTFNRSAMLREAIASVAAPPSHVSIEHWVIDGNSTDDTLTWLRDVTGVRWLSEPDRGLYDALNKGLAHATGEIIGFVNSDDLLVSEALPVVVEAFADPSIDVVTGHVEFFQDGESGGRKTLRHFSDTPALELNLRNVLRGSPNINARFFRRSFAQRVGEFDLAFSIAADREWLLRAVLLNPRQRIINRLGYRYREHSDSLTVHATSRNVMRYRSEHAAVAEKHLASAELTSEQRQILKSFHRRESATIAAQELRSGNFPKLREWAIRGLRQSRLWPLTFARRCMGMWLD